MANPDEWPVLLVCLAVASRAPRQYYVPEFGFVAEPDPRRTTTTPPKRSWNGTTHVRALAAKPIQETTWHRGTECTSPMQWRSLAHPYETDLMDITFGPLVGPTTPSEASWRSLLYALLEGAAERRVQVVFHVDARGTRTYDGCDCRP
ncbi:MAG: hypothetical protein ACRDQ5_16590 [Sciscionella sp.]